ncbi:DUF4435 domain-containing protein [Vibrio anguillarum]|uniref:DUF4435 domain-containing protein n=1 Tax=Vibrio anguillarum TaxID=55601 RepID=UPI000315F42A|nr:DUF4435 domain-containing protein [Vibrio anguillarum]OEE38502.1 hypothetical protein A1QW_05445 [Vibrio anguillarum]
MYGLPVRSDSANRSIGLFYRDLQDIEIYVEDDEAEALYTMLLSRSVNDEVKIKKVISLHGRGRVVEHCAEYNENSPALFIIDGDLDLLHGERVRGLERLYQHKLYCVENYLFCKNASAELLRDASGRLMPEEALEALDWDNYLGSLTEPLLKLFQTYAVAWKLMQEGGIKTVSRSYYDVCRKVSRARGSAICNARIQAVIDEIQATVIAEHGQETYDQVYQSVERAVANLDNPLHAISGKDYLLKSLRDYLQFKGATYKYDDGFKFKLARYCDTEPLADLSDAIKYTVNTGPYLQTV